MRLQAKSALITARLSVRRVLSSALFPIAIAGCSLPSETLPIQETQRIRSVTWVQSGTSHDVNGDDPIPVLPDESFELHWVGEGSAGTMYVALRGPQQYVAVPIKLLNFVVPPGCGTRYAVRVSSMPSGGYWNLTLGYSNSVAGDNPCPRIDLDNGNQYTWYFGFSALPVSPTDPNGITITRLITP